MSGLVPHYPFAVRIVARALVTWVGMHGLLGLAGGGVWLSLHAALLLVLLASAITVLDTRRCNEFLFLGNCGVPWWCVVSLCVTPVAGLEIILHLARAAWTTF